MDTSKEYILMCEKAKEIQKRKPEKGDFYGWPETDVIEVDVLNEMLMTVLFGDNTYNETVAIWLPRQDQLQGILSYTIQAELLNAFYTFAFRDSWCGKLDSMERLWLGFLMKEKYKKTWDGENWIKKG